MADDPRRYERIGVELPCRLFIPGREGLSFQAFASSLNLGLGGVFVKSSFLLRKGVDLNVEIALPEGPLSVQARVSHLMPLEDDDAPSGMGIEFTAVETGREALLHHVVPTRYLRFFDALVKEFPHLEDRLPLRDVALVLNLWEERKTKASEGSAASSRGPKPPPHRPRSTAPRPSR